MQERFQKNQHIALFVNFEIGCWDYLRKDFAFEEENEKMQVDYVEGKKYCFFLAN